MMYNAIIADARDLGLLTATTKADRNRRIVGIAADLPRLTTMALRSDGYNATDTMHLLQSLGYDAARGCGEQTQAFRRAYRAMVHDLADVVGEPRPAIRFTEEKPR